jgi:lactoylglutathione lyase
LQLGYVILYVPNVPATLDFYERAFSLSRRFLHPGGDYAELETGATALAFAAESLALESGLALRHTRLDAPPAAVEIALVTEELDAAYERAVAAGATPFKPPVLKPWGQRVAYVRDLNGALVELCTPIAPPAPSP